MYAPIDDIMLRSQNLPIFAELTQLDLAWTAQKLQGGSLIRTGIQALIISPNLPKNYCAPGRMRSKPTF